MARTVYADRMSDADALMWTIERDPILRSTILSAWVLDRPPDPDRLRAKLEATARSIPRMHQCVVQDPLGVAPPRWAEDEDFYLDYHVRRVAAPGKGTEADLVALAEPIVMQAFDRDRPLWELTLVDGLEGGRAGVLLKLHHAISDGVGLVRMTEGLVERSGEPAPPPPPHEDPPLPPAVTAAPWTPLDETLDALRYQASRRIEQGRSAAGAVLHGLGRLARDPLEALHEAADVAASARRLLAPVSEPMSPLMRGRSLKVRLRVFTRPLAALRAAGKRIDGTVNDAFVAAVAGGLGRYHAQHGHYVDELRMSMPVNLRHGDKGRKAGNQFAPVRFAVPVGIVDPQERMREIHDRVARERAEPSLPALDILAGALNRLPGSAATAAFGGMMKSVDFITSNVPGPNFPVWMSGARILEMIPFAPLAGAAVNATLFSYDGEARVGVASDRVAVPDPERLLECLEAAMDEVLATGS